MYFELDNYQQQFRKAIHDFAQEHIAPRDAWMDKNGYDFDLNALVADYGLFGLRLPKIYDGQEVTTVTSMIALEEIARASASEALTIGAHWLASEFILANGSDAQKQHLLPKAAKGSIFAFGLTEESAGSDAAGIKSIAEPTANGWILNGGKSWITNSGIADFYIILAKTDYSQGAKGISAFLLPAETEGLTIEEPEEKMGMRGSATCKLKFENIHLDKDALIGQLGKGFKYAMQSLDSARVSFGAISVGLAQHAMDIAGHYANTRFTFGVPLSSHQGISFKFSDMASRRDAAQLMTFSTARQRDLGQRITMQAAETKLFASEMCVWVCHECQQVLGGNGYAHEYQIEQLARDARLLEIAEGSNEILRMVVSNAELKIYQ